MFVISPRTGKSRSQGLTKTTHDFRNGHDSGARTLMEAHKGRCLVRLLGKSILITFIFD